MDLSYKNVARLLSSEGKWRSKWDVDLDRAYWGVR